MFSRHTDGAFLGLGDAGGVLCNPPPPEYTSPCFEVDEGVGVISALDDP